VDWIRLAQDGDQLRDFVNTVMNFWVPQKAGDFLTSRVTASEELPCYMPLVSNG